MLSTRRGAGASEVKDPGPALKEETNDCHVVEHVWDGACKGACGNPKDNCPSLGEKRGDGQRRIHLQSKQALSDRRCGRASWPKGPTRTEAQRHAGICKHQSICAIRDVGRPAVREKDSARLGRARAGASSVAEEAIWIFILWAPKGPRSLQAERW